VVSPIDARIDQRRTCRDRDANTFGGSSTTEYGPLLSMTFPTVDDLGAATVIKGARTSTRRHA
jgi:hypothetical protein